MVGEKDPKTVIYEVLREHDAEQRAKDDEQQPKRRGVKKPPTLSLVGNGNIQAGGDVNITVGTEKKKDSRPRVALRPGIEHIDDKQAARLSALVHDIYEAEAKLKQRPKDMRGIWSALNRAMGVPGYRHIPIQNYAKAEKYLSMWMGRLHSMRSAPVMDGDNWRKRHNAYIYANCKSLDDRAKLKSYLQRNFGTEGLTNLANDELEQVYRYVASLRTRRAKK